MYDAPGADSGREWVEVANLGSQNIDIGKYKLFENGTNHGLKAVGGGSVLAPNATAVIADDPQKFLADYPAFAGILFDSTFSLSNTGEALAIKDASSSVLDTVSYAAVADANGTGGTLNRQGEQFAAAMASPGLYPGPMTPVPHKAPAPAKTPVKKSASASPSKNPTQQGSANSPATAAASDFSNAASLSTLPNISEPVLIGLGLVATILLGIAGVFFIVQRRERVSEGLETSLSADEFTIE